MRQRIPSGVEAELSDFGTRCEKSTDWQEKSEQITSHAADCATRRAQQQDYFPNPSPVLQGFTQQETLPENLGMGR
jgi:hypothetical protein